MSCERRQKVACYLLDRPCTGEAELRALDSSIKRNTALAKKLRGLTEDNAAALQDECSKVNQAKVRMGGVLRAGAKHRFRRAVGTHNCHAVVDTKTHLARQGTCQPTYQLLSSLLPNMQPAVHLGVRHDGMSCSICMHSTDVRARSLFLHVLPATPAVRE